MIIKQLKGGYKVIRMFKQQKSLGISKQTYDRLSEIKEEHKVETWNQLLLDMIEALENEGYLDKSEENKGKE